VHPVNDAPQLTLPGPLAVDEDTPLAIAGIVIADVDVDPQSSDQALLVTLSVEHGTLTLSDTTGLTFSVGDGSGDATLVFSGSLDDLNAALATLSYQGLPDYHGPDQLTVTVNDQGHAGSGEALSDSGTIALTVHPVNDAPQLTLPADLAVDEDTPLAIPGIVIADVDVDPQSSDQALLVTLSVEHGTLTLGDTAGLTFSVGDGTGDATMVFSGSLDALNGALATLSYQGLQDYHGPDQLTVTVNDQGHAGSGEPLSESGTIDLTVHPVNDAPQLTLPGALEVDEDTPLAIAGIVIADVDVDPQSSDQALLVSLSVEHGTLTLGDTAGLTFSVGDGSGDATLVFSGSLDDVNAALATLGYQGLPNYHGPDQLTVTVNDQGHAGSGEALSDSGTIALTVHPVNDAPQLTLPGPLAVDEDMPLAIPGIVIADVDVDPQSSDQALLVTLSVEHGTLTLGHTTGLTFSVGDGSGDATLVFSGSLDDLNAALATLSYQGLPDYHGPDQLTVTVNDQGHAGSGEALSDSGTIALTVHPVNDAPQLTLPGDLAVDEDTRLAIGGIVIADVDVDPQSSDQALLVTLSVEHGTLTLGDTTGLTFSVGDGLRDATLVFSGSLDDVNAALATLRYQGLRDYHGPDRLSVTVNDQGHAGSGEGLSDSGTIDLTVHPVNDAPVARPNAYAVRADEVLMIDRPGILNNDTDVDGDVLTSVLISPPSHGRLTLNPDGSFRYVPDPSYLGTVSFTYAAFDGEAYSAPVRVFIRVDNPTSPVDAGSNQPGQNPGAGNPSGGGAKPAISGLPSDLSALVAAELPFADHGENDGPALRTRQHDRSEGSPDADGRDIGHLDVSSEDGAGWNELSSYRLSLRRDIEESQEMSLTPIEIVVTAPTVEPVTNSAMLVSEDLDDLSRLLNDDGLMQRLMIGSAVGLTTGLTVGYVLWTVRAGYLLTGLIAQMPAWKFVDPLFVLNSLDGDIVSSDGESLESILQAGVVAPAGSERVA
jgi:cytochrome c-type biogenesis protein CcmE